MNLKNEASLTIARIAPLLRRRRLSPVELTRWMLTRTERLQPELNAFISVTVDLALAQARRAEREIARGQYRGPLHGIPVSLKDLFFTRGIRTTAGSRILRSFVPGANAPVVDRLFSAGVVLVGKTNLHEFAFGATNVNIHYGPVRNPWDRSRISGGSSGGSAVSVVAAMSLASLGSDTGGSIRIPAAACGCVGLKPTWGRVPLEGVVPLATSLDHVGPICRCVEDAALFLNTIADPDCCASSDTHATFNRGLKRGVRGLRVGIPRQYFFDRVQTEIRRSVLAAVKVLEAEGAHIAEIPLRGMKETPELAGSITLAEALAYHWKWLKQRPEDYDPVIRTRMEAGVNMTAVDYIHAQERRRLYAERFDRALDDVDILAGPTLPVVAPALDEMEISVGGVREDVRLALLRLTRPGNLTGLPAISLPCGFSKAGLPIGLQLIGREGEEATVLRTAYAYERATEWHRCFPADPEPGEL